MFPSFRKFHPTGIGTASLIEKIPFFLLFSSVLRNQFRTQFSCCLMALLNPFSLFFPGTFHKTISITVFRLPEFFFFIDTVRTHIRLYIRTPGMFLKHRDLMIICIPQFTDLFFLRCLRRSIHQQPVRPDCFHRFRHLTVFSQNSNLFRIRTNSMNPGICHIFLQYRHLTEIALFQFPVKIIHSSADNLCFRIRFLNLLYHMFNCICRLWTTVIHGMHQGHPHRIFPAFRRNQTASVSATTVHGEHFSSTRRLPVKQFRYFRRRGKFVASQMQETNSSL